MCVLVHSNYSVRWWANAHCIIHMLQQSTRDKTHLALLPYHCVDKELLKETECTKKLESIEGVFDPLYLKQETKSFIVNVHALSIEYNTDWPRNLQTFVAQTKHNVMWFNHLQCHNHNEQRTDTLQGLWLFATNPGVKKNLIRWNSTGCHQWLCFSLLWPWPENLINMSPGPYIHVTWFWWN